MESSIIQAEEQEISLPQGFSRGQPLEEDISGRQAPEEETSTDKSTGKSQDKDIIIKCGFGEMIKAFFKDYFIVWHDPNLNSQENQKYMDRLKKFCHVLTFTDWQKASLYIYEAKASCHAITSGANGEFLVKEISPSPTVAHIYVFCKSKDYHSNWAKNYPKISCVERDIENVLDKIQQNLLKWYKEASSLKLTLPAFAPIFNDSDKSQMNHLHYYLKVIPNFKNREQAKNDFVELSKGIYSDAENQKEITRFVNDSSNYNKEKTLRWYSKDSFFFRVTNNCLRIATSDSIQYCRLPLKDVENAIKEQYQTKSKNFNGLLYRGAYLSEEEWSDLKANLNREIEMHGFLSVTADKNMALNFVRADPKKKVFITTIVPKGPNEEEQGFAEIEEFSLFPKEREILFNVRSRFTVLETEEKYSQRFPYRHLVLLYGAQGFRRHLVEQNPVQLVSITGLAENISCNQCNQVSEKMLFMPISHLKNQTFFCKKCLDSQTPAPFLCIPSIKENQDILSIKGFLLTNSSPKDTPFYGYQCSKCHLKKQKRYFICTDCDKKWCENCFENDVSCILANHALILEMTPFSFWCEKMSESELNHLKYEKESVPDNDYVFQQAEMYFQSHEYHKALQFYHIYIKNNATKDKKSNLAICYNNIGFIYENQGEYKKALDYHLKALNLFKSSEERESHPGVAASYTGIGSVYENQGKFNKALKCYMRSLDIFQSIFDDHPEVASCYNDLGAVYESQGDYKKALEYYSKSLAIGQKVYGNKHPHVTGCYMNIGLVHVRLGNFLKALDYYFQSLDICKSVHGEDHPDVAKFYNHIGSAYDQKGDYNTALEYHQKSLNIKKSLYGENHRDVATSYNNLGAIFASQGNYSKAEEYYLKALKIRESVYEAKHPDIAISYNNLGSLCASQGNFPQALGYYLKYLKIEKAIYGKNHPDVAIAYNNIGECYQNQGELEKALECCLKSLAIRESVYGEKHPDVAASYNNLGCLYQNLEEDKRALECYFKALKLFKGIYGENHSNVAIAYSGIGSVYESQDKYTTALAYCLKALAVFKAVHGENHPDVAKAYNNLGSVYSLKEEYEKAIDCYLKALEIFKSGEKEENRPIVATSYFGLGNAYEILAEFKKAFEYYTQAFEIFNSIYGEAHPQTIEITLRIMDLMQFPDDQDDEQ